MMKPFLEVLMMFAITRLPWSSAKCNISIDMSRNHNEILIGHVIKTVETNYYNCIKKCTKTNGCRSINVYKNKNGQEICDLNKSSKTAHPHSIVSMSGYEYDEITRRNNCTSQVCLGTPSSEWHMFNSSLFQLFEERMTWNEARRICQSLQGDLASITSQQEKHFIDSRILPAAPRGNSTNTRLIALWKLDGTDGEIIFHGEAKIKTVDEYKALYLDGSNSNFVTTPVFDIIRRGFSVGAWVKLLSPASPGAIYGDWSSPYKFCVHINESGAISFQLLLELNVILKVQYTSIPFEVWVHIMASWSPNTKGLNILINGEEKARYTYPGNLTNVYLKNTGHNSFDIGLERNGSTVFHGYMRELAVFTWPVDKESVALRRIGRWNKYDGVWIGLNDKAQEGTFVYSDGSVMNYVNWNNKQPNDLYKFEDCVAIFLGNQTHGWEDSVCGLELPFICRKGE